MKDNISSKENIESVLENFKEYRDIFSKKRDPERINKILKKIEEIWKANPDLRFGQLFYIITCDVDIFNIEDDELEKLIDKFKEGKNWLWKKRTFSN